MTLAMALANVAATPIVGKAEGNTAMVDWGHRMAEALVLLFEVHNKAVTLIAHQVEYELGQTSRLGDSLLLFFFFSFIFGSFVSISPYPFYRTTKQDVAQDVWLLLQVPVSAVSD